jgi:hypothetical protein
MRATCIRFVCAMMLAASLLPALAGAQSPPSFSREQLDQLMAPIALYPDELLSQVLMAATYPADVADAAKWSKANQSQKGDAALRRVADQPWDPSVQSLVAFPQVLQMMGDQPDWVQNLGDAFLASSKDVLDSAQRLRAKAQQTGSLKSTEQQKVVVEQEPQTQQTIIRIEPTNPEVVYVPAYDPAVVYGTWPYPAYPPYYYPPAPYYYGYYGGYYPGAALATGIAFGVGVAATAALWGNCNWGGGNVNVNVNRYNSVNANRQLAANQTNFQHNAANRRGVPYRDSASRQQFEKNVSGANQRNDFRGRETAARGAQRQQAQSALQQRGMDPGQGRQQLRNDPGTRDRAQAAARDTGGAGAGKRAGDVAGNRAGDQVGDRAGDRAGGQGGGRAGDRGAVADRGGAGGRGGADQGLSRTTYGAGDNALRGAGNAGGQTRQQASRGDASRQSMAQNRGGGGGGAYAGGGGSHVGGSGGGARPSHAAGGGGARMGGGGARGGGGAGGGRR